MIARQTLPVAIVGAGPIGLAAAAQLVQRGLQPLVLEQGASIGTALRAWGHVRVFSPWRYVLEAASVELLARHGWQAPDPEELPTGSEIVDRYLQPLADLPELAPHIRTGCTVTAIARLGMDKMKTPGRDATPFQIRYVDGQGHEHIALAAAVLDASGTWSRPNPLGTDGLPAIGEADVAGLIAYGLPDVLGAEREHYAGRSILVVGSGHSAINVVLALMDLRQTSPETSVTWALRRNRIERLLGGGLNDQLPARGSLGLAAQEAIAAEKLQLLAPFSVQAVRQDGGRLRVDALHDGKPDERTFDRIVVATGFRPDLDMLRELRLDLDPAVEAPRRLAPMIDPNLHSCGSVPPHGVLELAQPESGFFIIGSKSYGRAPTFLMATGYEQVRSVVAELAGDHHAARQVQLVLPETGVCSAAPSQETAGCCGGPAPAGTDACCKADLEAKQEGEPGCGCSDAAPRPSQMEPAE
ncbi:MAG: FAD-dependent oxidoreductase [Pseudorhizobium sp.]